MSTSIPTLSSIGWVGTPKEKADYALSYFITNNKSSSVLFETQSLQYTLKQFANKPVELEGELRTILERIMTATFKGDKVATQVYVDVKDVNKPRELSIRFLCTITIRGVDYNVGKLVESIDSKIVAFNTINS